MIYPVQTQSFTLYSAGATQGATTLTLSAFNDIAGTPLTMTAFGTIGYGTIEPNSTQEESITFTGITVNADDTVTLTGVNSVLFINPFTTTAALVKSHAGGTTFIITNTSYFYRNFPVKSADETIDGQWTFTNTPIVPGVVSDASRTVKGIAYLPKIETTTGATHSLTTLANEKVIVWAKGIALNSGTPFGVSLNYNGVSKDSFSIADSGIFPFSLMYTEIPGAGTHDITVTSALQTLQKVVIIVLITQF